MKTKLLFYLKEKRICGKVIIFLFSILIISLISAQPQFNWGNQGRTISADSTNETFPQLISDGEGGAIIVWMDLEEGEGEEKTANLYSQRIDAKGNILWEEEGVPICAAIDHQSIEPPPPDNFTYPFHSIIPDGEGGAIIVWMDCRNGSDWDIYAQRVDNQSNIDWIDNGVPICTASGNQIYPQVIPDTHGGAIIVWLDYRNNPQEGDIYAQRINSEGEMVWEENIPICTANGDQGYPQIIPDSEGGAIITWHDPRDGTWDIYAQRITAEGEVLWGENGKCICAGYDEQPNSGCWYPVIAPYPDGGAVITWYDNRRAVESGFELDWDIFIQRVDENGNLLWDNSIPITYETGRQEDPRVYVDAEGNIYIFWVSDPTEEAGNGEDNANDYFDLYVQKLNAEGNKLWGENGKVLCNAPHEQLHLTALIQPTGDIVAVWADERDGIWKIYSQWITPSGSYVWGQNGYPISNQQGPSGFPRIITASPQVIITWMGSSSYEPYDFNIYAQKITLAFPSQEEKGGSGCFIATAAFGSSFAKHVIILKKFRDKYLLTNTLGRAFVKLYYLHSPKAAIFIEKHKILRGMVRFSLYPLVFMAYLLVKHPLLFFSVILCFISILIFRINLKKSSV